MNRRDFHKALLGASSFLRVAAASTEAKLYFVDGYHGGIRGHMPAGSWRDIVTRLDLTPDWKLCLEIEPASWQALAERDPGSFEKLSTYLSAPADSARAEMVGGTFAQPYGWAIMGESNIRQLQRGVAVIHAAFPNLRVDTYAVQEPCWASCLPQILASLGFKAAVLKNPSTAWGGYSVGMDAETVHWIGPDGTSIRAVPRYACEELLDTWRTEAQTGSERFAEKCVEHGIQHPAGMCFQDLGWAARPNVEGSYIEFVTWRQYLNTVANKTVADWRFSMEDIRCALPWGEKTLQKIAREVRSAENKLIVAEKIAALAAACAGRRYPADELQEAWDKTLWSQHHDVWITATTRSGRDAWSFQAAAQTWDAEAICTSVIDRSLDHMIGPVKPTLEAIQNECAIHVFNTLASDRTGLVEVELPTSIGARSVRVLNPEGSEVPVQFETTRKYLGKDSDRVRGGRTSELKPGESIGAGRLLFPATVPATGYAVYTAETSVDLPPTNKGSGTFAQSADDGAILVETDLYRAKIEPAKGGILSSLYVKSLHSDLCVAGERSFHEFRGYFIDEKAFRSSTENPAKVEIIEPGPLRVTIQISGKISTVPFRSNISFTHGQRRIDFHTQFQFEKDTWIGDPWEIKPEKRRTGRRRSEYDDRFKLLALFPTILAPGAIYKNAAFDVCRSNNVDTFFNSWDSIKHNIILNWVDLMNDHENAGLGLFTDHTTSYGHGKDHPLSIVLAWGWDGGFWWGKCPLNGLQEAKYAVIPHSGNWEKAALWTENSEWAEPLIPRLAISSERRNEKNVSSLVRVETAGVQLSALEVKESDLFLRFFNAESVQELHTIWLGVEARSVETVELDGRPGKAIEVVNDGSSHKIQLSIPRFGIRTLRLRDAVRS